MQIPQMSKLYRFYLQKKNLYIETLPPPESCIENLYKTYKNAKLQVCIDFLKKSIHTIQPRKPSNYGLSGHFV